MGIGIMVCGLNGSGKSTFGKALSEQLGKGCFSYYTSERTSGSRASIRIMGTSS